MKAVHISSPGQVELADLPMPEPAPGEALLRVRYAGVCGSDLQTFTGNQPFATYPRIPGHEFSAEIIKINGEAPDLKQGMLVTGNPYFNCSSCSPCRRGLVNCCESNETMGVHRDGAFREYFTLPIERVYPGESLSAEQLAMIEPFSIGFHAATQAKVSPGDRVLVLGAGAIGIFALLSAKLMGASVWIADILPSRLEVAQKMGADGTILLTEVKDIERTARELTDNNGFDVALEATGVPESFLNAMAASMYGGRIALIGNGKREVSFNQSLIVKKQLTIVGSRNSLDAFKPLIKHVAAGDVNIEGMHTATYPFPQTIDAMQDLLDKPADNVKVLISF
ncbi:MAG TPA: zinc-binding alcohol dehydrogenase family protein [Propionibacteriaceae bacterium]|jgi:threonine dehydrogenase-like Zn-dependent dehydrogenase